MAGEENSPYGTFIDCGDMFILVFASYKNGANNATPHIPDKNSGDLQMPSSCDQTATPLKQFMPVFYEAAQNFPDFRTLPPLSPEEVANFEKKLEFEFSPELRRFLEASAGITMNGLSILAERLAVISLPNSDGLLLGEFYLNNPGDRLLMLPGEPAVYYLEQRDGNILRLAPSLDVFFNKTLPALL